MTTKRRVAASIGCVLLLMAALCLAACSQAPATVTDPGVESTDPEAGGGAGADSGPQTPVPTPTVTREASPRLDGTPLPPATATIAPTATATTRATNTPLAPTAEPPTVATTAAPPTAAPPTSTPPATRPTPLATSSPTPGGERVHVVQAGENLYRIGLLYGLSWVAIAEYNGITDPNAITAGQELRIPPAPTATPEGQTSGPTTDGRRPTAAGQTPAEQVPGSRDQGPEEEASALKLGPLPLEPPSPSVVVVAVAAGDTLYAISRQYGVNWAQIAEANGLATPNQLYPGQLLKIPPDVPGPTPEFNHRVHSGETLSELAQQYGLPADELAAANGLAAPYVIYSGQTLVIPSDE